MKSNFSISTGRVLGALTVGAAALMTSACGGGGTIPSGIANNSGGSGGGGTSATATPYALFASNYVAYAGAATAPYLHSIQSGDVFTGFGGNWGYGCYSSAQADLDNTQLYVLLGQADAVTNCPTGMTSGQPAPTTAADYFYIAIKAPGSNTSGSNTGGATSIPPLDISQSNNLLIQMGNQFQASTAAAGGNVNVITVEMSNDPQGNTATATAVCDYDQTLGTVGRATAPLGVLNYEIPFSAFESGGKCTTGSIATLQSTGVTVVAVKVIGSKNPAVTAGEFDSIAVGYIGFTK